MNSSLLVYALGLLVIVAIYAASKRMLKGRREVTYHYVERIFIFSIALVLLLVAILGD